MSIYWIEKPDKMIRKIVKATFPQYKGRKFKLSTEIPSQLNSYWNGGSIDSYVFYELNTEKILNVGSNHPIFETRNPRDIKKIPIGIVIVKHSICCGKDAGITIYANNIDVVPMLLPVINLTPEEKIVLEYTRYYKSSYAGIKNYRFHKAKITGISLEEWENAKASLIEKKMLNKRGAITSTGKNAIG